MAPPLAAGGGDEDEEQRQAEEFFDSREVMSPASSGRLDDGGWLSGGALLEVWAADPCSVEERRQRFARSLLLGLLDPASPTRLISDDAPREEIVLGSPPGAGDLGEEEAGAPVRGCGAVEEEGLQCVFKNLDDDTVFVVHEVP